MDKTEHFSPDSIEGASPDERATNIYVTQGGGAPRPLAPSFQPIPVEAIKTTTTETSTPTIITEEHTGINWGGVMKGVALVTGLVVVAAVGWVALSGLASYVVAHSAAVAMMASTGTSALAPVVGWMNAAMGYAAGLIPHIPTMLANVVSHTAGGIGIGTAGATMTALTPGATTAIGAMGAGSAVALAAPHFAHSVSSLNLTDHHAATVASVPHTTTTTTTTLPDGHEGGFFSNLMASKSAVTTHSTGMGESADSHAFEVGHHASHEHHLDDGVQADSNDHKRSWATRAQASNNYRSALAESGSHSAAVLAAKSNAKPVAPRNASFAEDLNQDRAALEAAMEPTR